MNLLYCDKSSGQVLGWHDDAQAPVAATLYGTNVRIIPYNQDVATLDRLGPPPDTGAGGRNDLRPYAQPTETPALLIAYAAQVRWEIDTAGITFNATSGNIPVACDRVSQNLIGDLVEYANSQQASTLINFTQAGVAYVLKANEVDNLFNAMWGLIQQARTIEAQCIADLTSASPTILVYDDVDAKFSGLAAKTRRGEK